MIIEKFSDMVKNILVCLIAILIVGAFVNSLKLHYGLVFHSFLCLIIGMTVFWLLMSIAPKHNFDSKAQKKTFLNELEKD